MKQKWKYAKPKKKIDFEEYLALPEDKKVNMTIKNWNFSSGNVDGENKTIFRADAIMMDGKQASKIVVIKSYDAVQMLKKELTKKKSIKDTLSMNITRKYSEDDLDYYYDIEFLD